MDSTKVGVLKEGNKVGLNRLLQSTNGRGLESQISLKVLGNLSDQSLEGQSSDQKLSGLLVSSDLTESNSTGLVSVGLLDATGRASGSGLSGGLGGELLSGSLTTGGVSSSLLSSSHFLKCVNVLLLVFVIEKDNFYKKRENKKKGEKEKNKKFIRGGRGNEAVFILLVAIVFTKANSMSAIGKPIVRLFPWCTKAPVKQHPRAILKVWLQCCRPGL